MPNSSSITTTSPCASNVPFTSTSTGLPAARSSSMTEPGCQRDEVAHLHAAASELGGHFHLRRRSAARAGASPWCRRRCRRAVGTRATRARPAVPASAGARTRPRRPTARKHWGWAKSGWAPRGLPSRAAGRSPVRRRRRARPSGRSRRRSREAARLRSRRRRSSTAWRSRSRPRVRRPVRDVRPDRSRRPRLPTRADAASRVTQSVRRLRIDVANWSSNDQRDLADDPVARTAARPSACRSSGSTSRIGARCWRGSPTVRITSWPSSCSSARRALRRDVVGRGEVVDERHPSAPGSCRR